MSLRFAKFGRCARLPGTRRLTTQTDPIGVLKTVSFPRGRTKYAARQLDQFVREVKRDGHCLIPGVLAPEKLKALNEAFLPVLNDHIKKHGHLKNRGPGRYYVTLPFIPPFADAEIYENPDILAVTERLLGEHFTMVQLATDTPVKGSEVQELHRDTSALFPETKLETPAYQLAINIPLVDIDASNGPLEICPGTHTIFDKSIAIKRVEEKKMPIVAIQMKVGDVLVRDVRHIHRGTPNTTDVPRPMIVVGYSRRWLYRPEVNIRIPKEEFEKLTPFGKHLLRSNPVVADVKAAMADGEIYQSFAY